MKSGLCLISLSLLIVLLTACSTGAYPQDNGTPYPLPCGEEVEWDEAVRILNQGGVKQVVQLHSLEVTLILREGCEIKTIEPMIDDIFHQVEKCGSICEDITLATE